MNRPHVLINVAVSADGKMDTFERKGAAISSPADKERVLRLRADADAVMVGGKTLLSEDPSLTVKREALQRQRQERGLPPNPIKAGVVSRAALNPHGNFLNAGPARVVIFTTTQTSKEQMEMLRAHRAEVFVLGDRRVDLPAALDILYQLGVRRLMVEGGGTLNFELLRQGLADELLIYQAPIILGGASAPTLADGEGLPRHAARPLKLISVEPDEQGGLLIHYQL
jgi:2,5-diamino-6-(ribosylamino)-4(3H)-pyrimidinone 5'-phosphate reductase